MKRSAHFAVGSDGESIAASYLRENGYIIVGRNIRINIHDEIDIIAYDTRCGMIVFVEVKSRRIVHEDFDPLLGLTQKKRRALFRAAQSWMAHLPIEIGYRIDCIGIASGKVMCHVQEIELDDWE